LLDSNNCIDAFFAIIGWKNNRRNLSRLSRTEIIEDDEEAWSEDNLNSYPQCSNDDTDFNGSYKR